MTATLITGANKGLGKGTARQLIASGHTVWVGARDEDRGRATTDGLGARFVQLDVTDDASIAAAFEHIAAHGGLDVLVNNAGIGKLRLTGTEALEVFDTNIVSVVRVTQAALPLLRASANPVVVNVSSALGSFTANHDPDRPASSYPAIVYGASKAAVSTLTVQYARAVPEVKFNAVEPGCSNTDLGGRPRPDARPVEVGARNIVRLATIGTEGRRAPSKRTTASSSAGDQTHQPRLDRPPERPNRGTTMMRTTPTPDGTSAWIITGPTSGIGLRTALELAKHGTVVLVGRDTRKLGEVEREIYGQGGNAVSVVCDLSDITSARRAAEQIASLELPIAGLLNNAGIMAMSPFPSAQGWDGTYATDHLGPFALTEALIPHLPDGANVVFIVSAVEDPERKPAVSAGFRGARYIDAEASARVEWLAGGSKLPGADAYATAKQGNLATALAFARQVPRLRFNAVEPGFSPGSNLGRDASLALRLLSKYVMSPLAPLIPSWSTPKRAARVIATVLTDAADRTGVYYDENGHPMLGSAQVRDPSFQDRVVAETRALLATIPADASHAGL